MEVALMRQARRLAWLLKDLTRSARGLWQAIGHARRPDHSVGIGLLEGAAWASRGEVNHYRIRVVNDSPEVRDVELLLRGQRAGGDTLEARFNRQVPGNAVEEFFLLTNWERRFEVASDPPPRDPCAFLVGTSAPGSCRVTATLSAGGKLLDELTIAQRLAE